MNGTLPGFSSGNGRRINPLSEESINRARSFFEEERKDLKDLPGFSSGSGRRINPLSEESINRVRSIFEEERKDLKDLPGFSSGNGRHIKPLSEESTNRARSFFEERKDLKDLPGFSSGNGRRINPPSEESTNRARSFFEEERKDLKDLPGFSSGNGRYVSPASEESLSRVRGLFDDIHKDSRNLSGFQSKLHLNYLHKLTTPKETVDKHSLHAQKKRKILHKNPNIVNSKVCLSVVQPKIDSSDANRKLFDLTLPSKRFRLQDIINSYPLNISATDLKKIGIPSEIITMTPASALSYRFILFDDQQCEGSEGLSTWGTHEALTCLIERGADPNLIDDRWVCNHYQWILWKTAAMIRSFPHRFNRWWCPGKVIEQLRYRYEREINCAHRSALKLIIEGDGNASWPMVLCVSNIFVDPDVQITIASEKRAETCQIKYGLELTDTWYKIRASIDQPLQRAIMRSKIRIGYKLEICGAKIVGGSAGIPALDISNSSICLEISANSTKLAHWDAKLGIGRFRSYALLHSLSPDGGFIPAIDVIVQRKYPLLFRETMKDGTATIRTARGEENAMKEHEIKFNALIESLINKFEKSYNDDLKKVNRKRSSREELKDITAGDELYAFIQNNGDMSDFSQELSSLQIERLHEYIQRKNEEKATKMNQWISEQSLIRVCDYHPYSSPVRGRDAIITIWNPDEFLVNYLQEGRRYKIYALTVAKNQIYPLPELLPIRLTSNRGSTIWKEAPIESNIITSYIPRTVTLCGELDKMKYNDEVDIVVIPLVVGESYSSDKFGKQIQLQNILALDSSEQMVQIEIKNSISIGMGKILKPMNILAFSNLRYRDYDTKYAVYILSSCDETEIKLSPCESHLRRAMDDLENWKIGNASIISKYEAIAMELCKSPFDNDILNF
ncbi:29235_t:CDS:10 [Gigaspora margarita]|uniref:29235_t:CDS:1 n=1 Tax=Gigaspora margarita TaxID=4874 RepID=A0ABN7VVH1_GIGMA|nr:29235_t:CDS:10 [Gigaspora margarita]